MNQNQSIQVRKSGTKGERRVNHFRKKGTKVCKLHDFMDFMDNGMINYATLKREL